jgi:hypothetical protein
VQHEMRHYIFLTCGKAELHAIIVDSARQPGFPGSGSSYPEGLGFSGKQCTSVTAFE